MSLINWNPTVFTYPQQKDYSSLRPAVNTLQYFIRHLNKSLTEVTILAISPIKRTSDFVIPQIKKVLNSCLVLFNFPNWKSDISSSQTRFTVNFKGQFCPRGKKKKVFLKKNEKQVPCFKHQFVRVLLTLRGLQGHVSPWMRRGRKSRISQIRKWQPKLAQSI